MNVFLSSFISPRLDFSSATRRVFLEKQRMLILQMHLVHASQFLVESKLLISFYFVCVILVTLCSLLWMSVFHVWSFSVDYLLLITATTLVPLIILTQPECVDKQNTLEMTNDLIWKSDYIWHHCSHGFRTHHYLAQFFSVSNTLRRNYS